MSSQREAEWNEARRRCRLSDEAERMARQMGLNPRSVIKNIPNKHQQWKAPVEDWIRDIYYKRFGDRKPEAKLPKDRKAAKTPTQPKLSRQPIDPAPITEPGPEPQPYPSSNDEAQPGPNLLREAEEELMARFQRGEIEVEDFSNAMSQVEQDTPVSEGEIAEENERMLNRYRAFRLAAEQIVAAVGELPVVQKVVLFGSVAAPPRKEVPRFRRLRRKQVAIWHECNDIDLAVWITDLSVLGSLKKALLRGLIEYQKATRDKPVPGIPNDLVDVFLFEPGTERFRGHLCNYSSCPRGKVGCEVAGCGAQRYLRLYEDYKFDRACFFSEHNVVLFEHKSEPAAQMPSADETGKDEIPF